MRVLFVLFILHFSLNLFSQQNKQNNVIFQDTIHFKGYLIRDNKTGVIKLNSNINKKNINLSFKRADLLIDPRYVRYSLQNDRIIYDTECDNDFSSITKYNNIVIESTNKYNYVFVDDIFYLVSVNCSYLRRFGSYNHFCSCKKHSYIKMYSFYCYQ